MSADETFAVVVGFRADPRGGPAMTRDGQEQLFDAVPADVIERARVFIGRRAHAPSPRERRARPAQRWRNDAGR